MSTTDPHDGTYDATHGEADEPAPEFPDTPGDTTEDSADDGTE